MYAAVYLLNIRNTLEDNVRRGSGNSLKIPDTAPTTQTQTNMSRYSGSEFDLPSQTGTHPWGYVERGDEDIIEHYQMSAREEGERFDDRELDVAMSYEERYGPDAQLPPEYPFQDFNYGP
jgi:hypothetical protein